MPAALPGAGDQASAHPGVHSPLSQVVSPAAHACAVQRPRHCLWNTISCSLQARVAASALTVEHPWHCALNPQLISVRCHEASGAGSVRPHLNAGHAAGAPQQLAKTQADRIEAQHVVALRDRKVMHEGVAGHCVAALAVQVTLLHSTGMSAAAERVMHRAIPLDDCSWSCSWLAE